MLTLTELSQEQKQVLAETMTILCHVANDKRREWLINEGIMAIENRMVVQLWYDRPSGKVLVTP